MVWFGLVFCTITGGTKDMSNSETELKVTSSEIDSDGPFISLSQNRMFALPVARMTTFNLRQEAYDRSKQSPPHHCSGEDE